MMRTRCDQTGAWTVLHAAYQATGKAFDVRQAFTADATIFMASRLVSFSLV